MKKYILMISVALTLSGFNSCSDRDLELLPPNGDLLDAVNTASKLQMFLTNAYLSIGDVSALGNDVMLFGDVLGDKIYNTPSRSVFLLTYNYTFSADQNQFKFYRSMYDVILSCNMVINNTKVPQTPEVVQMKGEAKILRGIAYYYLVSYYSPTPASGVNQEFGVPLVLNDYDVTIQPARATVSQVYDQIIADLNDGIAHTHTPTKKVFVGPDAAKIVLSRLYLTRRAPGDAELALQYATDVKNHAPMGDINAATNSGSFVSNNSSQYGSADYQKYWVNQNDAIYEGHGETIWEIDMSTSSNPVMNIGSNGALPVYYSVGDATRRCILANATFYNSIPATDIRRGGNINTGLFSTIGNNIGDTTPGYWVNKYPRTTSTGNFNRNIRIFRYSEAELLRIEALRLTNPTAALSELNAFASARKGTSYSGTNLLDDILTEKSKEFFSEGQRFLDLKRYGLPVHRPSNCTTCDVQGDDYRFVLPITRTALNNNANLKQYPGY
ncbi:MAG: hypothetical protein BGO40_03715 [Chryseobacterium sp. 39-10]|nr:RagB/SusD family nutrient uptake outer membrane protein [Chryseobacterium sp.]OJV48827.1 MAG: hypothetical protein BGO40_03715 [Chryseobacterium sp. 39-10]